MIKALRYELNPTEEQKILLDKHFGACRFIYNWALAEKQRVYSEEKRTISCFELSNKLPKLKEEFTWLKAISSNALQQAISRLDTAFTKFFKLNQGFPKFKSKHSSKLSYSVPAGVRIKEGFSQIFIPKLKWVKFFGSKINFEGKIKTCIVSKTPTNRYFISVLVDNGLELPLKPEVNFRSTIGIDLGLKDFAVLSTGEKIRNPKFLNNQKTKLSINQQRLAKKVKGSKSYLEQKLRVAKIHESIANKRKDFHHKLSTRLVSENQTICMEDLNVRGLLKNENLAKAISDVGWNQFTNFVKYKCELHGKNFVQIGRFDPSSKTCSSCGSINHNLTLKDRVWECFNCGIKHDRDINAAQNIKLFGYMKLNKLGEEGCSPSINKACWRGE